MPQQLPTVPGEPVSRNDFRDRVRSYIAAGFTAFLVENTEISRVEADLRGVSELLPENYRLVTWDIARGCSLDWKNGIPPTEAKVHPPQKMLERVQEFKQNTIVVLHNFDIHLRDPAICQQFQNMLVSSVENYTEQSNRTVLCPLVILAAKAEIPARLRHLLTRIDYSRPDAAGRRAVLNLVKYSAGLTHASRGIVDESHEEHIIAATAGLGRKEIEDILALGLIRHGRFQGREDTDPEDYDVRDDFLQTIEEEKARSFQESVALEYYPKDKIADENEVGGFEEFKNWLHRRSICFTPRGKELQLDPPKGVVLIGVPGTGKSLVGRVAARMLGQALVRFDIGSVFGSLVGESEKRMREALATIDALQGCVVLVDEADKVWGGASESTGDSGVTRRIFGSFLTWLQEKESHTFVIMTMNRTLGIPPEFLRKGRFDEVFWVDMPNDAERQAILSIHLTKRGVAPDSYSAAELKDLVSRTNQFVGAEIEDVVKEAKLVAALRGDATPTAAEIVQVISSTRPLSQLDAEGVKSIRDFCRDRARPVSAALPVGRPGGRRSRNIQLDN